MFKGRRLLIATQHQKETVIAPVMEKELDVNCFTTTLFNTDDLGTFSGERDRKDDPITTVRQKCLTAMELANCDLGIASEGSFGPHPTLYFLPADEEVLIFIDKKNNLEVIVRELSTDTNFNGSPIHTEEELLTFAKAAKFPEHALIIKDSRDKFKALAKGITSDEQLKSTFKHFISTYGKAFVETDMRAMYNPTRMKVIQKAAIKLAGQINTNCPKCSWPGFGITEVVLGLPCGLCNTPTRSVRSYFYTCLKCSYTKEQLHPNGKPVEEPTYCDYCNP